LKSARSKTNAQRFVPRQSKLTFMLKPVLINCLINFNYRRMSIYLHGVMR